MKFLGHFSLFLTLITFDAQAQLLSSNLTKSEIKKLEKGEMLLKTKEVKDLVWPEITIYQKIEATPLESVAIFYALDHQKNYIPNLIKSDVVKEETPTRVWAEYELSMPWPLSNSKYLHGHELGHLKAQEIYSVKWWMIESNSTEKVEGEARFQKFNNDTLMEYKAIVVPKSFLASFVESKMLEDVKASLKVTKDEVLRAKKEDQNLLNKYVSFIENALSGKFSYLLKKE